MYFSDSLLYVTRPSDSYDVQTGSYLGDLTDEVEKDYGKDARITEVICAASKSYGYQVETADGDLKTTLKSKGFGLNFFTSQLLSYDRMKAMILKSLEGEIETLEIPDRAIRRLKNSLIVTMSVPKKVLCDGGQAHAALRGLHHVPVRL